MNRNQSTIKVTLRHTLLTIVSLCAVLLLSPGRAQAQDGVESFTVAGSAGATVDETGQEFFEVRGSHFATMKADAPVGTTVTLRYNLTPQGDASGGYFGFDCTSCVFDMLVRYQDNGPGFRVVVSILEARLNQTGLTLHNLFDSDDPSTTAGSTGTVQVDSVNIPRDQDLANHGNQSIYDLDQDDGPADSDGARGRQRVRFGGSAFFLEVKMTKLSAAGEGGFVGASIVQTP